AAEFVDEVENVARVLARPAVGDDAAVANVRREHDGAGIRLRDFAEPIGLVDRTGADDHALCAVGEEALDFLGGANPAADLHRRRGVGEKIAYDRAVGSAARRRIEIHDVQPLEAVTGPAARDVARIAEANLLLVEVSADELHDAALAKVYGRDGEHVLRVRDEVQVFVNESQPRTGALLRMELYADHRASTNSRGKPVALVCGPSRDDGFIDWAADETVRVVCGLESRAAEERIARVVDGVPADLRGSRRAQPGHAPAEHAEPRPIAFVARIEHELHAEADSETRKAGNNGFAH